MRSPGTLALTAALALALLSCGGGGGSPSDPDVVLNLDMNLHNATNSPTILRASVALDGTVRNTVSATAAVGALAISGGGTVRPGHHTITIAILDQTSSPNDYYINGLVVAGDGRRIFVQQVAGRLATGESLTTSFDV